MAPNSQEAEERKRFFDHLFSLDEGDDNDHDNGCDLIRGARKSVNDSAKRNPKRRRTVPSLEAHTGLVVKSPPLPTLNRARTEPSPRELHPSPEQSSRVQSLVRANTTNSTVEVLPPQVQQAPPPPTSTSSSRNTSATKKQSAAGMPPKSRKPKVPEIPEERKVFRNLVFYFIPNDDIASSRRRRIEIAQRYGAQWIRRFDDNVTHVIVDKHLKFKDVTKHLKMTELPESVVFVNEDYPAECIGFLTLLNGGSSRFRIDGHVPVKTSAPDQTKDKATEMAEPVRDTTREETPEPEVTEPADEGPSQSVSNVELGSEVADSQAAKDLPAQELAQSQPAYEDDLNRIIQDLMKTRDLPIDLEEDANPCFNSTPSIDSNVDTDDEDSQPAKKKAKKGTGSGNLSTFSCMQKSEGNRDADNPNRRTMDILQEMASYYDGIGDTWRTRAYRKAISELRKQGTKVMTRDEAIQLPNIGERLALKIEEIVWTNRLRRLESTTMDPNDRILQLFMGVYGVGYAQAQKWIAQGHRTLEDLSTKAELTTNQKVGVEHYDDFQQRIPRDEVTQHGEVVRREVLKQDSKTQAIIGGSYRRGAANSGDIDLIITKEGASISDLKSIMVPVIARLEDSRFLVAGLATGHSTSSGSKWHGASCLPSSKVWRRIDLLFVPWAEFGAALIYFTGNDIFNRSIRLLASKKGMRLNQHGLYGDVMRGPQRSRLTEGRLIEGQDENRIFEILGVPYRPPEHRIC